MNNLNEIRCLLSEWLVGTIFSTITFAAGFSIRLERSTLKDYKPNVLKLDIRSAARVGDEYDWKRFIQTLPLKARRGEEEDTALAYRFMLLLGAEIKGVDLLDDGSISIVTTDEETVVISGVENVWEESWALVESRDIVEENPRSIVCGSDGKVVVT